MTAKFTLPDTAEKPAYVRGMFDSIAHGYDAANDWMTAGRHRAWKRKLVGMLAPKTGEHALDLATGTGDLARLLAAEVGPDGHVTGLDFSPGMLARAREGGGAVEWVEGDMLALPVADARLDVVTVGFGLRNVADLNQAIAEIVRVLKPGGRFGSLEMGRPRGWVFRTGAEAFNRVAVPIIGKLATGDDAPYRYLHASSLAFLSQDELAEQLRAAGLTEVRVEDVLFGTCALVTCRKP